MSRQTNETETLAEELLERMTDAFISLDREWRVVYMNGAARRLNERPGPDVIGRSHWEAWPMTVGTDVERQYRHAMATQKPVHFEYHYMNVSGLDYWHSIHAYPSGNGLSIFYRDVTAQKRGEAVAQLLAKAGAQFASTLDQASTLRIVAEMGIPLLGQFAAVYLVEDGWRVRDVSMAAPDEAVRSMLRQVVAQLPVTATDPRLPFNRAMHRGEPVLFAPVNETFYAQLGDNDTLRDFMRALAPQSLLCMPLIARGRTIGGITYGTVAGNRVHDEHDVVAAIELAVPAALALDNSRLYEAERRARRDAEDARRRAEEANHSKVDFIRAMSHELRTPLNAIAGYVQLLRMGVRGALNDEQRNDLERIERNQLHLTHLINDVTSFARLEAGRVHFDCRRVPVADLMSGLETFVAPQIAAGDRALRIKPPRKDAAVWADPDKATQILVNLMSNALKHTPRGTAIEVLCDEARLLDETVQVSVRDAGPGIPLDKHEAIFEPFVQGTRNLSNPIEGLGLGLAIARALARGMNGDLTVSSEPGRGATFTLVLPRG